MIIIKGQNNFPLFHIANHNNNKIITSQCIQRHKSVQCAPTSFLHPFSSVFLSPTIPKMGNLCTCLSYQDIPNKRQNPKGLYNRSSSAPATGSNRWSRMKSSSSSSKKETFKFDDPVLHQQALAAAAIILQQQRNGGSSLPFDRSTSLRYPLSNGSSKSSGNKNGGVTLPRSSSTRARSLTDPLLQPHQLLNQDGELDGVESNYFVLVHGGGFGAWCWYKTIALLEESGYKVTAIDLTGSGIHSSDTNGITSLSQYVKPLTDFLEKLSDAEKVILVGHDFGGACISYAMELFPSKVLKAVFIAATMLTNGQSALDIFSHQEEDKDLMKQAQIFVYANGNNNPPTAIDLDKSMLKELLFNQSPTKDVALASVSMRPIPFAPVLEKLCLLDKNYGSVRRFYIETTEDNAIPIATQEQMTKAAPPEQVFRLKGADHSPFFSKPQALHRLFVEISKVPQVCESFLGNANLK